MIFDKKSLKKYNVGIKTLFCLIILLLNTFFESCRGLTDQYVLFNNATYQKILLHIADYEYVYCFYLQTQIVKI